VQMSTAALALLKLRDDPGFPIRFSARDRRGVWMVSVQHGRLGLRVISALRWRTRLVLGMRQHVSDGADNGFTGPARTIPAGARLWPRFLADRLHPDAAGDSLLNLPIPGLVVDLKPDRCRTPIENEEGIKAGCVKAPRPATGLLDVSGYYALC
jgi:hypothetical protein